MRLVVRGADQARIVLGHHAAGARRMASGRVTIDSPLPYAYGIETGRHRGGRLARRAGGAWMLRRGLAAAMPSVREIARGSDPTDPVWATLLVRLGGRARDRARGYTPVVTGALRASLRVQAIL